MKVIIQQPDLDTCMTGVIMNVGDQDSVKVVKLGATDKELADPKVLCIEAGGSGSMRLNNFDHHDPAISLPPASRQALQRVGLEDNRHFSHLVDYVCSVDEPSMTPRAKIEFPSLSAIFSGMRIIEKSPMVQFRRGIQMLKVVLDHEIDPWQAMPDFPQWRPYRMAKQVNRKRLNESLKNARVTVTRKGFKMGVLETEAIGGMGLFHSLNCDIVLLHHPKFGMPPVSKFTICSKEKPLDHLLSNFQRIEQGWGGRRRIIGSPRIGTKLDIEYVLRFCEESL